MKERDILRFEGPLGTFFLREDSDKPIVLLASGTGFAPVKALVEHMIHLKSERPVTPVLGRPPSAGPVHARTVRTVGARAAAFQLRAGDLGRAAGRCMDGRTGFVHAAVMQDIPDLSGYQVYACGAPVMVDSARRDYVARSAACRPTSSTPTHSRFHGRTIATMSASGKPGWDTMFAPQVPGFPKAELNDLASVERLISKKTVAVMLEPVQGEGGVIPATREFMQGLRRLTKNANLLLIVDEVQTGVGRTGELFGYQLSGIEPDIMTLGKGIGGGVPLAALLAREEIACFEAGEQGGTYNGNPLMTAVGAAVVKELLKPDFLPTVKATSAYLSAELIKLSDKHGFEGERGEGLLRALKLGKDIGPQIVEAARDLNPVGLLLNSPRPNLIRFMPSLNVTKDEIDQMLTMLEGVLVKLGH
jgi:hypothetical protein